MSNEERKEFSLWWLLGIGLVVIALVALAPVVFGLNACGAVGGSIVERKVNENSYQNSEARKTEIMTYEAQLVEIDAQLARPNLTPEARANLESNKAALNVRLKVAKEKYDQVLLKQ